MISVINAWLAPTLTREFVAQAALVGMGLDALGGCYLAYDLLGGRTGPLGTIARATGYVALFFVGYVVLLGLSYALVAATGMGILLAVEYRRAAASDVPPRPGHLYVLTFGFLRGVVLGLSAMTIAGVKFGAAFGFLSGFGLSACYAIGFAPVHDYGAQSKPNISKHKVLASLSRALAVSAAGMLTGLVFRSTSEHSVVLGLRMGLAAGVVSALVGLFSPTIEWRIESLPERRLGVFGLGLILLGMVFQSVQYWLVVFDVTIR